MDVLSYLLSKKYTDTVISQIANFETYILDTLPETGECHIFYIVPGDNNETHDLYIWAANKGTFEKVGSTKVDLTNYYNKDEINDLLKNLDVDFTGYATEDFVRDAIAEIKLPETYDDTEVRNLISEKADKVHSHEEYALVEHTHSQYLTESHLENYATKSYVEEEIANAKLNSGEDVSLEGYATEEFVTEAINKIEIPEAYNDAELRNLINGKADSEHTHEEYSLVDHKHAEYLTEHQDLSHLALKEHEHSEYITEHQSLEHLALKEHKHDEYLTEHQSLEDYAKTADLFSKDYNDLTNKPELFSGSYNDLSDKPELFSGNYNDLTNKPTIPEAYNDSELRNLINSKADSVHSHEEYALAEHTHDEYLTEHQSLADYAKKTDLPSIEGLASEEYVRAKIAEAALEGNDVDLSAYATKEFVDQEIKKIEIPESYNDEELRELISNKADKEHSHEEYALVEHSHEEYLTEHQNISHLATKEELNDYAKSTDIFSGNYEDLTNKPDLFDGDYNSLTNTPSIPSIVGLATEQYVNNAIATIQEPVEQIQTKLTTEILPVVEKVTTEIEPTVGELKTWVENKEYLQDIDLDDYATKQFVTDEINKIENTGTYDDSELRELINNKSDMLHDHDGEELYPSIIMMGNNTDSSGSILTMSGNAVFTMGESSEINMSDDAQLYMGESSRIGMADNAQLHMGAGAEINLGNNDETIIGPGAIALNTENGSITLNTNADSSISLGRVGSKDKTTIKSGVIDISTTNGNVTLDANSSRYIINGSDIATEKFIYDQQFATKQYVTDALANLNVSTECVIGGEGFTTNITIGHLKAGTDIRPEMTLGEILRRILVCDHDYGDWVITKQPEVGVPGEKQQTCKHCGEIIKEIIPALPEPEEPVGITYLAGTFGNTTDEIQEWPSPYIETWTEEEKAEISNHYVNNMIEYTVASEEDLLGRHGFAITTPFVIESQSLAEYGDSSTDPYITRPAIVLPEGYEVTAWNTDVDNSSLSECTIYSYELTDGRIVYYAADFPQQTGTTVTHYLTITK